MRQALLVVLTVLLAVTPDRAQAPPPLADYTTLATHAELIVKDFVFHDGARLPEIRLNYVTWGTPRRAADGSVTNAVLLLHGTLGDGLGWGRPVEGKPVHPLLGPGGPLDVSEYFVIAPDTIGSGRSSRPSDGLRMKFPRYNLHDIVAAERLVVEHLGVRRLVAVIGASMGGRQAWQWAVQYPDFMDGVVPMIASPFPNAGLRGVIDVLPVAMIKGDPAWNEGEYESNPDSARLAAITYGIFLSTPSMWQERLPTREAAARFVREGQGAMGWPDANDLIYMMKLNDGFDAWSQIEKVACPVLMINMAGDQMVPTELGHARQVVERVKQATYIEVTDEAAHGHGALSRTFDVWGPRLREWLEALPARNAAAAQ